MTGSVPPLDDVTGARQELTVVLPVRLLRVPAWSEGPFPFELGSRRTDAETRSTYFAPASARALYGAPGRPRRWYLPLDTKHDGLHLLGMELLRAATARRPEHALAVLHFSVERPLLPVLRALAGRRSDSPSNHSPGRSTRPGYSLASPTCVTPAHRSPSPGLTPSPSWPRRHSTLPLSAAASRRTSRNLGPMAVATGVTLHAGRLPLPPETAAEQLKDVLRISADWSALVLRQGAAFLGHRTDTGTGDFFEFGALHSRTVYLDALLLGALQRDHIDELTDELSEVFTSSRLARRVATLERNIAVFRSTYWRQHLTAHGAANDLLLAFQNQHRLPARFQEILAEAADYSRLVQTQESQQISGALGVLTILGLPLGTALGILQVVDDHSVAHLLIAVGLSVAATAAVLTTRYGRLVLSSLRGGEGKA